MSIAFIQFNVLLSILFDFVIENLLELRIITVRTIRNSKIVKYQ